MQNHTANSSSLVYNNEVSLTGIIMLAYYSAAKDYTVIKELPTGEGFEDMVFILKKAAAVPAMIVELKWDKTAEGAITQIKNKGYALALEEYKGSMPAMISGANSNSQIFYSSYLTTYIGWDVRELSDAIDSLKFFRFITAVAARCGQMLNIADIERDADINQIQAKDWLGILETSGIIFYLRPYSNNLLKRLVKTSKLYFYDTGLVSGKVEKSGDFGVWCDE